MKYATNGAQAPRPFAFQLEAGRVGLIEIFQPLTEHPDGNLLPLWELYAAAKRAKELKKQGREKLFSDADIAKALALKDQYPVLETVARQWERFNGELLDLAAERGVLDPAAVKAWKANFYVPFYRAMEEAAAGGEGPRPKKGLEGHGGAIGEGVAAARPVRGDALGRPHRGDGRAAGDAAACRDGGRRGAPR